MKLKSEYYNSIKKLPVCLWFDINETGDVLLLGKKSRLRVFMESFKFKPLLIWSDKLKIGWNNEMVKNWDVIYNEWLAKYQTKEQKRKLAKIVSLCLLMTGAIKGDRLKAMKAKIEIQGMKPTINGETTTLYDSLITIETDLNISFPLDPEKLSTDKYFSYLVRLERIYLKRINS